MLFHLVRHAQSHVNLPDWDGGFDTELTELGRRQAAALAAWLPSHVTGPAALYASTMQRARQTVQAVAATYGMPPIFDDRIREIGNNRLDHVPWSDEEFPTEYSDYWASERPFSNVTPTHELGETHIHFMARVGQFLEEMARAHSDEAVIVVTHGGVIEMALSHIFNVGPFRRAEAWTANTGITTIEFLDPKPRRERWRLHYHNRVDHLTALVSDE